jgi:hypothetical protein
MARKAQSRKSRQVELLYKGVYEKIGSDELIVDSTEKSATETLELLVEKLAR